MKEIREEEYWETLNSLTIKHKRLACGPFLAIGPSQIDS